MNKLYSLFLMTTLVVASQSYGSHIVEDSDESNQDKNVLSFLKSHVGDSLDISKSVDVTNEDVSYVIIARRENNPAGDILTVKPSKNISIWEQTDPVNNKKSIILKVEKDGHPAGDLFTIPMK